ncbi:MAG: GIY-YIG nuclease family protein [Methylomarinum sp.]|nr:GIY-YIG nuclease family protein [Methylococcales bacterium]NOR70011.1 GIY-YIG nuclease family protein [Methylomarinum sp.]
MIHCTDGSLYTGISTDVEKRYTQHETQKGAKYFRGRKPKQLVYQESGHDRSSASKREIEIKKLSRVNKMQLILSTENQIKHVGNTLSG